MAFSLRSFLTVCFRREIVRRALITAVLIGSVLGAINHGPDLLDGMITGRRWFQIGLTYLVPYCVATYSAAMQELRHRANRPQSS
jgi:hypothetical protein